MSSTDVCRINAGDASAGVDLTLSILNIAEVCVFGFDVARMPFLALVLGSRGRLSFLCRSLVHEDAYENGTLYILGGEQNNAGGR
jgi:hypothetical protein